MKRWQQTAWHSPQIIDRDGPFVCSAGSSEAADRLIAEHNALVDAAEALQLKMSPFTNNQEAHDKALAALAKLRELES